jgi:hypothetical protein
LEPSYGQRGFRLYRTRRIAPLQGQRHFSVKVRSGRHCSRHPRVEGLRWVEGHVPQELSRRASHWLLGHRSHVLRLHELHTTKREQDATLVDLSPIAVEPYTRELSPPSLWQSRRRVRPVRMAIADGLILARSRGASCSGAWLRAGGCAHAAHYIRGSYRAL